MKMKKLALLFVVFILAGFVLGAVNKAGSEEDGFSDIDVLLDVVFTLSRGYIEPVSKIELLTKYWETHSIKGMLEVLEDRYTYYMDKDEFDEFMEVTDAAFGGIGVYLGMEDETLIVVEPMPNTPGERAGLINGDRIVGINGRKTEGMLLEQAVPLIRGEPGTKVILTIERGQNEQFDVEIIRGIVELPSIAWEIKEGNIGYLRIFQFANHTVSEVKDALDEMEEEGIEGLVMDLRFNPGGYLAAAIMIAEYFVAEGPIIHILYRDAEKETLNTEIHATYNYPTTVLVNKGTASGSEILAGALQDTGKGLLVGTETFGKGVIQHIVDLKNGGGLAFTVAEYLTAGEQRIHNKGLKPDYEIDFPEYTDEEWEEMTPETFVDVQLEKALEITTEMVNESKEENLLRTG